MKRIIILLAVAVFSDLSAVTPMLSDEASSSSSAPDPSSERNFELLFFIQGDSTETREPPKVYLRSSVVVEVYRDVTKLDYKLIASSGIEIFANSARNTDIVSLLGNKMKIRPRDNVDVLYSLEFKEDFLANVVGNLIISAESAQYKRCDGSDTYKLQNVYKYGTTGDLDDMGPDYCIFKMHKTNMTTFTIRYLSLLEYYQNVTCIFRSGEFRLTQLPNEKNKLELKISFGAEFLDPKYVLKTSTPDKLRAFLDSA